MAKRDIPEINAGSIADIAFLLLIFFLVTTTMNSDTGISRNLPERQPDDLDIHQLTGRNVFLVMLNRNGEILVENETYMKVGEIKEAAMEFIDNGGGLGKDGQPCDYCRGKKLEYSSVHPNKVAILMGTAKGTKYGDYVAVQNELVAAYNTLRDRICKEKYGIPFTELMEQADNYELSKEKKADLKEKVKAIKKMYPMILLEQEPVQ